MYRPLLTGLAVGLALATGCSFYTPPLDDCTVRCADNGACPAGGTCSHGACSLSGRECECAVGEMRTCGQNVGECRGGQQQCVRGGAWGPCLGAVDPTPELCDGKDNDCDGLVDLRGVARLDDHTETIWYWEGTSWGYVLLAGRLGAGSDGGIQYVVRTFDRDLRLTGEAPLWTLGFQVRWGQGSDGDAVYLASWTGEGASIRVVRIEPNARVVELGVNQAADFYGPTGISVPADGGDLMVSWLTMPPHSVLRVGAWGRDGGVGALRDLPLEQDAGIVSVPDDVQLTHQGRYARVLTFDAWADGGLVLDDQGDKVWSWLVVDVASGRILNNDPAWVGPYSTRLFDVGTAVAAAYTTTLENQAGVEVGSAAYLNPDLLTTGDDAELVCDEDSSDVTHFSGHTGTVDGDGAMVTVWLDNVAQRMLLARVTGLGGTGPRIRMVQRPLARGDGFGEPRVASPPGDPWVAVAWRVGATVEARLVCGPREAP